MRNDRFKNFNRRRDIPRLACTKTVVSSAWMRSAANTCVRMASTIGISVAAQAPTQSASVETSSSTPSQAYAVLCRLSGRCRQYLENNTCASSPGPARPRAIGCEGAGGCVMLAGAAGELLAHVLDHFPLPRHELQHLGHVLADLVQKPAAAGAGCRGRINDALARQMLGQRAARRPAPLEAA